jgi:hypothetical protein
MLIAILFFLGICNFALHKAVLESGHPMLARSPWFAHVLAGRVSLVLEFVVLLAAMLLAYTGWLGAVWIYVGYTSLNGFAAWLILSGRI